MLIATDKLSGEEFWSPELKLMGIFASEVASSLRKAYLLCSDQQAVSQYGGGAYYGH
jgi:hypothetical protein